MSETKQIRQQIDDLEERASIAESLIRDIDSAILAHDEPNVCLLRIYNLIREFNRGVYTPPPAAESEEETR